MHELLSCQLTSFHQAAFHQIDDAMYLILCLFPSPAPVLLQHQGLSSEVNSSTGASSTSFQASASFPSKNQADLLQNAGWISYPVKRTLSA